MKPPPSLLFCILMDAIGCATYVLPVIGEFGYTIWAPISAIIFYKTFGGWKSTFGGVFNFIEEILPALISSLLLPSCGFGNTGKALIKQVLFSNFPLAGFIFCNQASNSAKFLLFRNLN